MRIFLSSYKLGNHQDKFIQLVERGAKIAIVMNAADDKSKLGRFIRFIKEKVFFAKLGYKSSELDLRDYFNRPQGLEKKLEEFSVVWVRGGNTFILKRAFEQSGFDSIIKKMLMQDTIIYGGSSAGTVIMTPTLHGIELVDDPTFVPNGYSATFNWDGLNIIPYVLAVHFESVHPGLAGVKDMINYYDREKIFYKTLRDSGALVIDGDREEIFQ